MALFWSSSWADKTFQRQLKESRKLEDVILAFVSAATKSLRKEHDLADGQWKVELNPQVLLFLDLLHDSLGSIGSGATDLRARLNTYRAGLQSDTRTTTTTTQAASMSSNDCGPLARPAFALDVVMKVLPVETSRLSEAIDKLRSNCTVEAALEDITVSL